MRKSIVCLLGLLLGILPLHAQNARELLDKAASTLTQSSGLQASFGVRYVEKSGKQMGESTQGSIELKNKKFKLKAGGVTTWFDGKTQWSYVPANEEVNVSEPDESELESINPYAFVNLYKQGYTYKMGKATQCNGHAVYEVDLLAKKKSQSLWQIVLMIDKQSYHPVQIKARQKNDQWFILNINSLQKKQFADSYFTFQKSEAPNAEIIDLR